MNHTDLHSIAFDTLPASSETQGIGIHKGIRYRRGKFVALDAEGLERNYRVTVSSLAKRAVKEDWLTDAGKAEKLRRAEAEVPEDAKRFVAAFFQTAPCGPHNAVMLARFICRMDPKFNGLLNWQQLADFRAAGFQGTTNGEALDFIFARYRASLSAPQLQPA